MYKHELYYVDHFLHMYDVSDRKTSHMNCINMFILFHDLFTTESVLIIYWNPIVFRNGYGYFQWGDERFSDLAVTPHGYCK